MDQCSTSSISLTVHLAHADVAIFQSRFWRQWQRVRPGSCPVEYRHLPRVQQIKQCGRYSKVL